MRAILWVIGVLAVLVALLLTAASLRPVEVSKVVWPLVESMALDEFVGVTADGVVEADLFAIAATGVSTEPVRLAAEALLAELTPEQREQVLFPVDDDEWRRWANIHISTRQGVGFAEMNEAQVAAV